MLTANRFVCVSMLVLCWNTGYAQQYAVMAPIKLKASPEDQAKTADKVNPAKTPIVVEVDRRDGWVQLSTPTGVSGWARLHSEAWRKKSFPAGMLPIPMLNDREGKPALVAGTPGLTLPRSLTKLRGPKGEVYPKNWTGS